MLSFNKIIGLLFFLLVFLFKLPIINMPCHWDDLVHTLPGALFIYKHGFNTVWIQQIERIGHPPLFFGILAFIWSIFGYSIWISHLVVIIFSFVGVYFTYLLGAELKDNKTGFIAALFLFFSPLYFAQSGTLNLDLPLTALMVMTLYFFLKGNTKLYFLCGIFTVFTKVSGILLIVSAMMYGILKGVKKPVILFLKKIFVHLGIFFILIMWLIYYKYNKGWVINPLAFWRPITTYGIKQALKDIVTTFFFADYHFFITVCIICSVFLKGLNTLKYRLLLISVFLIAVFFLKISKVNLSLIIYLVVYATVALQMIAENKKYLPVFLFMFLGIFFLSIYKSFADILPRYLLIFYPFYFIIGAICLVGISKKNNYLCAAMASTFIVLSISSWYNNRSVQGVFLESNLEYLDQIKTHKLACKFIMDNYPQSIVITFDPLESELKNPEGGYVTSPVKSVCFKEFKNQDKNKDYLVYYSEQAGALGEFKQFLKSHNLTLLKYYESNGKIVKIYRLIKD